MAEPKPASAAHPHRRDAVPQVAAVVITVSDTRTLETDTGGKLLVELFEGAGHSVAERVVVPDDVEVTPDGDLLVRMNFAAGALSSVEFKRWDGTAYQVLTSVAATGACQGTGPYVFCTGSPALAYPVGGYEVYDIYSTTVASVPPDGFAEVGMDVAGLLGSSTDFTSIAIRTPTDIAFGNFSAMGYWVTVNAASQGGN